MLIEAAKSTSSSPWGITKVGLLEKNNSALAAAVSRPGFPAEISVFYTDNNEVLHDLIYNSTSQKWNQGIISQKNYKAYPNSTMSAMYNQCRLCSNTLFMTFQDQNGFVQMAKFQDSGWTSSQLDVDPVLRTGLALLPSYKANRTDNIMLFHQKSSLAISLANWDSVSGWNFSKEIYSQAPRGTPIAAASSYSNVTAGYETWRQLLKLSKEGVEVSTWSGAQNDWLGYDYNHTAFANETGTNVKTYGSLAVTAIGSAYAVVESPPGNFSIQSYQMSDRLNGWQRTGNVTTWD
ncbi:uncharacterized protein LY89DRAFT_609731 [Mollisia scopiformis]|uniref:Uncharacterized protein n=1 Tax=Mollisia scopiformis TaxID=149040 RepID=A0A194XN91_MOLSC|nr:uncharacterized protein LY89DRAFT_609731 [Mollisia scopiformis]KUJ21212.1 hypothetical protein LY89DRAFT_609731 [Mollisia scopiformis]